MLGLRSYLADSTFDLGGSSWQKTAGRFGENPGLELGGHDSRA